MVGSALNLQRVMQIDESLFIFLNYGYRLPLNWFFWFISQIGNVWVAGVVLFAVILLKSPVAKLKKNLQFALVSLFLVFLSTFILKNTVDRSRPVEHFEGIEQLPAQLAEPLRQFPSEQSFDAVAVTLAGEGFKQQSFPSSHASTSFAVASVMVLCFGGYFWLSYLLAALISYSRIHIGVHFPLDVLSGAVLGITLVWLLYYGEKWYRSIRGKLHL
ncbi:phosphatase PAP2 family protein [Chitinispirillales bacterium ANBcel5]|uniref:phosphatase PAP2 family protein n=1 Tax=Cellulosispirillum alkaliphilum TaxID=3039283 RepID=UPI002A54B079|nr:phosphatase PAP2 family protein [Chitinispirillales bacterium ANBcel5]